MAGLLPLLLAAAAPAPAPVLADAGLDRRCYALMAALAGDADPRLRSVGLGAAHYFLGRIDATGAGFDPGAAAAVPEGADREALLRRCGAELEAAGHDFRSLGEALARPRRPRA